MERDFGNTYVHFVLAQSVRHRDAIRNLPFSTELANRFARLAEASLVTQRQIEAADTVPFETYREQYLSPLRLIA
jgi:glutamate--cysteine ligase